MTLFDQTGDRGHTTFYRLAKLYGIPDYVKEASIQDTGLSSPGMEGSSIPVTSYADPRVPAQFPCHTKAATYLSYLYFLDAKPQLSKHAALIEERFQKFAEYWGLLLDCQKLRTKAAEVQASLAEPEIPDTDYMLVTAEAGEKVRYYPIRNALETKAAADWFVEHRYHFPFVYRKEMAAKILEKAAQYGAAIGEHDDTLQKQAGRGFCRPKEAAELIRSRVRLVGSRMPKEAKEHYEKLAQMVEVKPFMAMTHDNLATLASTVDQLDRAHNVQYSEITKRAEDVLFQVTYKEASDHGRHACETLSGSVYDSRDFDKVALEDIRSLFGEDFAKDISTGMRVDPVKLAEIATTLPRPDAQLLDRLLADANIYPVKQANVIRYEEDALKKMAEYYEAGHR